MRLEISIGCSGILVYILPVAVLQVLLHAMDVNQILNLENKKFIKGLYPGNRNFDKDLYLYLHE